MLSSTGAEAVIGPTGWLGARLSRRVELSRSPSFPFWMGDISEGLVGVGSVADLIYEVSVEITGWDYGSGEQ